MRCFTRSVVSTDSEHNEEERASCKCQVFVCVDYPCGVWGLECGGKEVHSMPNLLPLVPL